jgi:hypothetical protein
MDSDYSPNMQVEKASLIQSDLRRTIMTESILFIIIGATCYLSLIFLPRDQAIYLIGAILYGGTQIISGSVGLYGSYKVHIRFILAYLILLVVTALYTLLAIFTCIALFIKLLIEGIPSCSTTCDLTRFVYIVQIFYFVLQTIVAIVLLVFAVLSFRHTRIFYKKEKKFVQP